MNSTDRLEMIRRRGLSIASLAQSEMDAGEQTEDARNETLDLIQVDIEAIAVYVNGLRMKATV